MPVALGHAWLTVDVRVAHPSSHSLGQPSTYSSVLGSQPQGTVIVSRTEQDGTGHRRGVQSAGWVCWVTVGHAGSSVVVFGGSVVTPVLTDGLLVVVEVVRVVLKVGRGP